MNCQAESIYLHGSKYLSWTVGLLLPCRQVRAPMKAVELIEPHPSIVIIIIIILFRCMDRVIGLFGGPERDDYDGLWSRCDGHELDDGGGILYCGDHESN